MHEEDRNFILATWLKGLRYGNDWFQAIDSNVYFAVYQKVILAILADPRVTVNVACLKDDPEVILGYSVHSGNRLDWLFVKKSWRCIGIGKSLIPEGITLVSHLTSVGRSISRRRNWVFNPFSIS
jgi:GNAT superfamily N-acetyltransferase